MVVVYYLDAELFLVLNLTPLQTCQYTARSF
jgi:hypothetical protein